MKTLYGMNKKENCNQTDWGKFLLQYFFSVADRTKIAEFLKFVTMLYILFYFNKTRNIIFLVCIC